MIMRVAGCIPSSASATPTPILGKPRVATRQRSVLLAGQATRKSHQYVFLSSLIEGFDLSQQGFEDSGQQRAKFVRTFTF